MDNMRHIHLKEPDLEVNLEHIEKATRDGIVRCKECVRRSKAYLCPMRRLVLPLDGVGHYEDFTRDDGYCHMGEKKVDSDE